MSTVTRALAAASEVVLGATAPVFPAQPPASQGPDMSIDESTWVAVIDGVVMQLADFYVCPDAATKMGQAIRQHQQHRYDAITSARTFAETLTSDLREVSHDRHLALNYSFSILPTFQPATCQLSPVLRRRSYLNYAGALGRLKAPLANARRWRGLDPPSALPNGRQLSERPGMFPAADWSALCPILKS
jgi:hypothetical protein